MTQITDMPSNVLCHILSFMKGTDCRSFSLTQKEMYERLHEKNIYSYWILLSRSVHHAAAHNEIETMKQFIKMGLLKNQNSLPLRKTPLYSAVCHRHVDMARLLLENGADKTTSEGIAIKKSVYMGDLDMVKLFYSTEMKRNWVLRSNADLPIIFKECDADMIMFILEKEFFCVSEERVNEMDYNEIILIPDILRNMVVYDRVDVMFRLMEIPELSDYFTTNYVLDYCVTETKSDVCMRVLLDHYRYNSETLTRPLKNALQGGFIRDPNIKKAKLLLDYGADVNAEHGSCLWYAIVWKQIESFCFLLDNGIDLNFVFSKQFVCVEEFVTLAIENMEKLICHLKKNDDILYKIVNVLKDYENKISCDREQKWIIKQLIDKLIN